MDASWLKLIYFEKIVMNTPWPFEVSLKKEDILKDMKKWLAFVNSEVCCNHNNNQQQYKANVHTVYVANEGIIFKSEKRGGSCCG